TPLLPLDRCRRLSRNVVYDARDSGHFVDDSMSDAVQKFIRQGRPASGHEIDGLHGTQRDHMFIAPPVAHHADGTHRQEYRERLTDLVVKIMAAQLFDEYGIRTAQ